MNSEFGIKDFIDLDAFFWHIFNDVMSEQDKKLVQPKEEFEKLTTVATATDLEELIRQSWFILLVYTKKEKS